MHKIILGFLFAIPAFGQVSNPSIIPVDTAPTGTCTAGLPNRQVSTTGVQYSCQNGTWGAINGGSGGSGTVNAGTTGQIGYYAGAGTAISGNSATADSSGNLFSPGTLAQPAYGSINCWGDSLTSGNQDGGGNYCSQLGVLSGLTVVNQGVSGNTSAQILTRMQAAPPAANTLNVIWACTNDTSAPTCLANIATMVALVQSQGAFYLVLPPLNADTSNKHGPYGPNYLTFVAITQKEKTLYPGNFVDIHAMLVGLWNSASVGDVGSWGWDLAPESIRAHYARTLSADITASTCAITLSSTATQNFTLVLDSEVIFVTTSSGNSISACTRGYMGTTAATHTSGTVGYLADQTHLSSSTGYPFVASQVYQWMLANPANTTTAVPNLTLSLSRDNTLESSLGGYITAVAQRCTFVYQYAACLPTVQLDGATAPLITFANVDSTNRLNTMRFQNLSNIWDFGEAGSSAVNFQLIDHTNSDAIVWSVARTTDAFSFPLAAGVSISGLFTNGATKFTATGCTSITSTVGNGTAGKFTIGGNACTVVITLNGATGMTAANGWSCNANDRTTAAGNAGLYFSADSTTTATLTVPVTAAASDVIDFSCRAY